MLTVLARLSTRVDTRQRWLYSCYTDFWARVSREATGYRKILILDGDLGELDTKRRSVQLITANKSTILSTVRNVLEVASELSPMGEKSISVPSKWMISFSPGEPPPVIACWQDCLPR